MWVLIGTINNLHLSSQIPLPFRFFDWTIYLADKFPYKAQVINYLRNNCKSIVFTHIIVRRTKKLASTSGRFVNESFGKFNAFFSLLRIIKPNNSFVKNELFLSNGHINMLRPHESNETPFFISKKNDQTITKRDIVLVRKSFQSLSRLRSQRRINKILNSLGYLEQGCKGDTLAERIIWLFTALEAIFNLNESELTFKLSSRVSWYLYPKCVAKRREIFKGIKNAYNYRSEIVHGELLEPDDLKKNLSFLENVAWATMRKVLLDKKTIRILTDNEGVSKEYFERLILGK